MFTDRLSPILDWVYPRRCMICEGLLPYGGPEWKDWLCPTCAPLLEPISGPVCEKCGGPLTESEEFAGFADNKYEALCPSCVGKKRPFGKNTAFFTYDFKLPRGIDLFSATMYDILGH